jgi:protoheme IX farnesyltransferase
MSSISTSALTLLPVRARVQDFWALTKLEVNFLIVLTTCAGFNLGAPDVSNFFRDGRLLHTLLGTLLVASGAGALNQLLEHSFDARMRRTKSRPIADGRLHPQTALRFGIGLTTLGAAYLLLFVNSLASILAAATAAVYLFVYTPLKRKSPLSTIAGALAGATPPLIGWAGAAGSLANTEAWLLYLLLFLWQFPHFMAIAWMYREDYARAGYLLLPSEHDRTFMAWFTAIPSIALFAVSIVATVTATGGRLPSIGSAILGLGFLYFSGRLILSRSKIAARQLLKASIVYLPLELLLLVVGKT